MDSGISTSDVFVRAYFIDELQQKAYLFKTPAVSSANPVYNENVASRGGVFLPATGKLEFEILDEDIGGATENIGYVIIDVSKIV